MANGSQRIIKLLEKRIIKVIRHLCLPWRDHYLRALKKQPWGWGLAVIHYLIELPLLILDVFGFPEAFNFLQSLFKRDARLLDEQELQTARLIFEDGIDWSKVRIDEQSKLGTQRGKYAYVSYYYINCSKSMTLPVLMHELVHILQYEQNGSPYIFRNLIAHWSKNKYNYGGLARLETILGYPETLHQLNFEQRADIISDYFLIASGNKPEWGVADHRDVPTYLKVIKLVLQAKA